MDGRMNEHIDDRRPLKTRSAAWARQLAAGLARSSITPNHISVLSIAFAAAGATVLLYWPSPLALLACALCIQLRLLCNLLDGMVAIEGGKSTATGVLFNEFPDRVADSLFLVLAGDRACRLPGWPGLVRR